MTAVELPVQPTRRLPLALTADDRELQSAVRGFLRSVVPAPTADRAAWAVIDPHRQLWLRMAREVGIQSLAVPEDHAGQGFGLAAAAIAFEELGRVLCPAPFFGTVALAGRLLTHCSDSPGRSQLLERISEGACYATAALDLPAGRAPVVSDLRADAVVLDGTVAPVVDGDLADVLLVFARGATEDSLYAVDLSHPGVTRTPMTTLDLTRGAAAVTLQGVPGQELSRGPTTAALLRRVESEARALLAAESVGTARAALDAAVDYAKLRTQFGQPLGSFQSLKHRMADMLAAVESAWAATRHAVVLADEPVADDGRLELASRIAKASASDALSFVAAENIQIHGGIGFTWEHSAHLYYRRARTSAILLGLPATHRDHIATLLLDPATAGLSQ